MVGVGDSNFRSGGYLCGVYKALSAELGAYWWQRIIYSTVSWHHLRALHLCRQTDH